MTSFAGWINSNETSNWLSDWKAWQVRQLQIQIKQIIDLVVGKLDRQDDYKFKWISNWFGGWKVWQVR